MRLVPLCQAQDNESDLVLGNLHDFSGQMSGYLVGESAQLLACADEGHRLAKLKNRLDAYSKVTELLVGIFSPSVSAGLLQTRL